MKKYESGSYEILSIDGNFYTRFYSEYGNYFWMMPVSDRFWVRVQDVESMEKEIELEKIYHNEKNKS